ncbi:DUF2062 domain-containing protein [Candidatus Desantisbacteria bacterium]|nr:DUF2062 domain-containing protein [Candidatus Desantisbacteria bacterium]
MNNKKKLDFLQKILRIPKYYGHRLKRLPDTPRNIAMGASIGVFWGIFPTFMLGIPIAVGTAAIFKANKTAAFIGSLIMNPITTTFFWGISAYIGGKFTNTNWRFILKQAKTTYMTTDWKTPFSAFSHFDFTKIMKSTILIYLLGNTIVSILFSYIAYFLVFNIVENYQKKRLEKISSKKDNTN